MKKSLLLLGVIASFAMAAPAHSQFIFMDVNGDAANNGVSSDVLSSAVTSIDIYLDTNHDANGTLETCKTNATQPLDIFSYDMVVHSSGSGSISISGYTNSATNFALSEPFTVAGADCGVGYTAPIGGNLAPGRYKLGTFAVTVTGTPVLTFVGLTSGLPSFGTGFGSSCDASEFGNTEVLGIDFFDGFGTAAGTPTESTTWGKIKQLYR